MSTDHQLVTRALRGDSGAFAELYDRYATNVLRYAFALAHDADDAQDLLQETFITAWRKLSDIRFGNSSALPWLLVTCRNHAQNLRRSKSIRASVPIDEAREPSIAEGNLDRLAREEELRWVLTMIRLADDTDRRIVEACIVGGMPYRDAALRFGLSEQAVAKRIHRLRSRLSGLRAVREGEGS
jgi:RNA polymerase sigma factor (sigma-70 family)